MNSFQCDYSIDYDKYNILRALAEGCETFENVRWVVLEVGKK